MSNQNQDKMHTYNEFDGNIAGKKTLLSVSSYLDTEPTEEVEQILSGNVPGKFYIWRTEVDWNDIAEVDIETARKYKEYYDNRSDSNSEGFFELYEYLGIAGYETALLFEPEGSSDKQPTIKLVKHTINLDEDQFNAATDLWKEYDLDDTFMIGSPNLFATFYPDSLTMYIYAEESLNEEITDGEDIFDYFIDINY